MTLAYISNNRGSITIDFCVDNHRLETWFEVHIGVKSTAEKDGFYKVYKFATYRTANNKMEHLAKKHNIH